MKRETKKTSNNRKKPLISAVISVIIIGAYLLFFSSEIIPKLLGALEDVLATDSFPTVQAEGTMSVHVIDVGQGDCTLFVTPQKTVLIDGGENDKGDLVTKYIKNLGIKTLDLVVATHSHSDHIGGLDVVIDNFDVKNIVVSNIPKELTPTAKTFTDFLNSAKKSGANTLAITKPYTMDLVTGSTIVVFPPNITPTNINDTSLYARVSFGNADFLSTGDAEAVSEKSVLDSPYLDSIEVLSVGHHGSNTSSTQAFLNRVSPLSSYISLAKDNSYGHPHKEPLLRLQKINTKINRTDLEGTITYTTDGDVITVRSDTSYYQLNVKE